MTWKVLVWESALTWVILLCSRLHVVWLQAWADSEDVSNAALLSLLHLLPAVWPLRSATAASSARLSCTAAPSASLPTTATAPARLHAGRSTSGSVEPSRRPGRRPVRVSGTQNQCEDWEENNDGDRTVLATWLENQQLEDHQTLYSGSWSSQCERMSILDVTMFAECDDFRLLKISVIIFDSVPQVRHRILLC